MAALASDTRGIFAGGYTPTVVKKIERIEITSTGNSTDFGNLTTVRRFAGGMSDCVRGVVAAGHDPSATQNMDYFDIDSDGNADDFGDQGTAGQTSGTSNAHGVL